MLEVRASVLSICVLCLVPVSPTRTCTRLPHLPLLLPGEFITNGTSYRTLENLYALECVNECMKSSPCKAINFDLYSGECFLYREVGVEYGENSKVVRTNIQEWPRHLSGACSNHSCPDNTICMETKSWSYECKVIGCLSNPNLTESSEPFLEIGVEIMNRCADGFYSAGSSICKESGYWSEAQCLPYPRNCSEVKKCNSSYGDGEYWLFYSDRVENKRIKIYCHLMSTDQPKEYVTLIHENFSEKSKYFYKASSDCDAYLYTRKIAHFAKVGIKVDDLDIQVFDLTFSNVTSDVTYGAAADCLRKRDGCQAKGVFVVNLRKTSFIVSDKTVWEPFDFGYSGSIYRTPDNQVILGTCGGRGGNDCIMCDAKDGFLLEINPHYQPDFNSAVLPTCAT